VLKHCFAPACAHRQALSWLAKTAAVLVDDEVAQGQIPVLCGAGERAQGGSTADRERGREGEGEREVGVEEKGRERGME